MGIQRGVLVGDRTINQSDLPMALCQIDGMHHYPHYDLANTLNATP